ncbi:MAG: TraB/TrbI/VirB10 family type IV secretion system protein [Candidatus Acidiferrales bacterium]
MEQPENEFPKSQEAPQSLERSAPPVLEENTAEDQRPLSAWERFKREFDRGWQMRNDAKQSRSRQELRKDKSKSLVVLGGCIAIVLVVFLVIFSSPHKAKMVNQRPVGAPDLGRRVTPGQGAQQDSLSPLLSVTNSGGDDQVNGITPQDVDLTGHTKDGAAKPPQTAASTALMNTGKIHSLADIHFADQALEQQYAMHGTNPPGDRGSVASNSSATASGENWKKPSLVFVRSTTTAANQRNMASVTEAESPVMEELPAGTRLVARLQAPVSTAIEAPAVAVVEYNYEEDGQIILPAGSQVIGKLENANKDGFVSLHFDQVQLPDGRTQRIDASAMGLDYKPLRGYVSGRKRALKFLVQSLTGIGEAAAYVVGSGGNSVTAPFSESTLMREQLANNVATAGQNQLNALSFGQSIVVTVPGNTRFYLVLEKGAIAGGSGTAMRPRSNAAPAALPTIEELQELVQLKRELAAMYQQANTAQSSVPSQPQQ